MCVHFTPYGVECDGLSPSNILKIMLRPKLSKTEFKHMLNVLKCIRKSIEKGWIQNCKFFIGCIYNKKLCFLDVDG